MSLESWNGSDDASESAVAVSGGVTVNSSSPNHSTKNDSKPALSDIYDEQGVVFEIRRPYFDLSNTSTDTGEEEERKRNDKPLSATATAIATLAEYQPSTVPTGDENKVNETLTRRRVSFHSHPPYFDKISPLTSSGSEDMSLGQVGPLPAPYIGGGGVQRTPHRLHHRHRGEGAGRTGGAEGGTQVTNATAAGKDKYPLSPLVRYASKSSDQLPYEETDHQQEQPEKKEEIEHDNNRDAPNRLSVDIDDFIKHQLQPVSLDSSGSIQSSSHNFPVGSASSVLSSKASIITIAAGELLAQVPCGHIFHKECILEWANQNTTCPVCRKDLTTGIAVGDGETVTATAPRLVLGRSGNSLFDE